MYVIRSINKYFDGDIMVAVHLQSKIKKMNSFNPEQNNSPLEVSILTFPAIHKLLVCQ